MIGKCASSLKWAQGTSPLKEKEEERRETLGQSSLHRIQMGRATGRQLVLGQCFEEPGMLWENIVDEPSQKHRPLNTSSASKANKMRKAMPFGKTVTASPSTQVLSEMEQQVPSTQGH